jgi:hypothetical protein
MVGLKAEFWKKMTKPAINLAKNNPGTMLILFLIACVVIVVQYLLNKQPDNLQPQAQIAADDAENNDVDLQQDFTTDERNTVHDILIQEMQAQGFQIEHEMIGALNDAFNELNDNAQMIGDLIRELIDNRVALDQVTLHQDEADQVVEPINQEANDPIGDNVPTRQEFLDGLQNRPAALAQAQEIFQKFQALQAAYEDARPRMVQRVAQGRQIINNHQERALELLLEEMPVDDDDQAYENDVADIDAPREVELAALGRRDRDEAANGDNVEQGEGVQYLEALAP